MVTAERTTPRARLLSGARPRGRGLGAVALGVLLVAAWGATSLGPAASALGTSPAPWAPAPSSVPALAVYPAAGSAALAVLPSHGFVASSTNASGGGFAPTATITLTLGSTTVSACTVGGLVTNSTGNFSCVFVVPVVAAGAYTVGATDGTNSSTAPFTVDPPTLAGVPTTGRIGTDANFTGSGYDPSTPLTVDFGTHSETSCLFGSLVADASGNLSCGFRIPTARAGVVTVSATDGTNTGTTPYTLVGPNATVAPASAQVSAVVDATGTGFAVSTLLTLRLGGAPVAACKSGSLHSNASGDLQCDFAVPTVAAGTTSFNVTDGTNNASAAFTVLPPTLAADPTSGYVGQTTDLTGTGYAASDTVTAQFGTTSLPSCTAGSLTTNATGALNCTVAIPTVTAGTYSIVVSDGVNQATATYVVGPPTLSLSPTSGYVGTEVAASGAGYVASTALTITFAGVAISSCVSGSLRSDAQGDMACTFDVPASTVGSHLVAVSDGTNSASAPYTVLAEFLLAPGNGTVGTTVTATGTGFDATSTYSVSWNGSASLCAGTTSATGGFSCSFEAPDAAGGSHLVTATEASNTASAAFVIDPSLTVAPTAGSVARAVSADADGLDALAAYTIVWDGTLPLCSGTTDSNGGAACSFDVPPSPQGLHTVTAEEGAYAPSASFQVSPALSLAPAGGAVATPVTIAGTGLDANASYLACFQANVSACPSGTTVTTNASGSTPPGSSITVPSLAPGAYYVDLSESGSFVASAPFAVTSAVLGLSPASGPVGSSVALSGSSFDPNSQYVYCFQPSVTSCSGSSIFTADASGNVPSGVSLTVPGEPGGTYYVDVSRAGLLVALAAYNLTPNATLQPGFGAVGSLAAASADGLDAQAVFDLEWNDSVTLCSGTTTATGTVDCTFTVPSAAAGLHVVSVREGGYAPTATFRVVSSLTLNVSSGTVGSRVTATGTGFDATSGYTLAWNATITLCSAATGSNGGFSCSFGVPSAPEGAATLNASTDNQTSDFVFVVLPRATVGSPNGTVGTLLGVYGLGLPAASPFSVAWNGSTTVCAGSTSAVGSATCSFSVPAAPAGTHGFLLEVGATDLALAFTVDPAFGAAELFGFVGGPLNVTGTGFDALAPYSVTWNGSAALCTGTTDASGGFVCDGPVPLAPGGPHALVATERSRTESAVFTITAHASVVPAVAPTATVATLNVTGLDADRPVAVTWNSTLSLCANATTGAQGAVSCTFTVPTTAPGIYWVNVSDGVHSTGTLFTVNATAPTSSSTAGTPFPWWVLAAIVVGALVAIVAAVLVMRRRPSRRPAAGPSPTFDAPESTAPTAATTPAGPLTAPVPTPAAPAVYVPSAPAEPLPASPPPVPTPAPTPAAAGEPPDIDLLIQQLDKIAGEILKRPAPAEAKESDDESGSSSGSS